MVAVTRLVADDDQRDDNGGRRRRAAAGRRRSPAGTGRRALPLRPVSTRMSAPRSTRGDASTREPVARVAQGLVWPERRREPDAASSATPRGRGRSSPARPGDRRRALAQEWLPPARSGVCSDISDRSRRWSIGGSSPGRTAGADTEKSGRPGRRAAAAPCRRPSRSGLVSVRGARPEQESHVLPRVAGRELRRVRSASGGHGETRRDGRRRGSSHRA